MTSIKCSHCRLVNFSTATHCKRCQQPLNEFSNIAAQRPFHAGAQEAPAYQNPFQPYHSPPAPPAFDAFGRPIEQQFEAPILCVKCGGGQSVHMQHFKKDYVPPVAYLGVFMGILPFLILVLVLKVNHKIDAPFCIDCWDKFKRVNTVANLGTLAFLFGIIGAIVALVALESGFAFLFVLALTIGFVIWTQIYRRQNSPKFKKVDRQQVIIDAPGVGEIRYANY